MTSFRKHCKRNISLVLIFVLLCIHSSDPIIHRSDRVVKLQNGNLQGFIVKPNHRALGMVEVFLGVPYAAPPVGDLRFMPPMQSFPWAYIRRAETMPPVCPQKLPDVSDRREALKRMPEGRYDYLQRLLPMLRNQSEDCLYLNIYVPMNSEYQSEDCSTSTSLWTVSTRARTAQHLRLYGQWVPERGLLNIYVPMNSEYQSEDCSTSTSQWTVSTRAKTAQHLPPNEQWVPERGPLNIYLPMNSEYQP